jgi:hypothetical protein
MMLMSSLFVEFSELTAAKLSIVELLIISLVTTLLFATTSASVVL